MLTLSTITARGAHGNKGAHNYRGKPARAPAVRALSAPPGQECPGPIWWAGRNPKSANLHAYRPLHEGRQCGQVRAPALILASFWSWVLIVDKSLAFRSSVGRDASSRILVGPFLDELLHAICASVPNKNVHSPPFSSPRCANGSAPSKVGHPAVEAQLSRSSRSGSKSDTLHPAADGKIERGLGYLCDGGGRRPRSSGCSAPYGAS